MVNPLPLLENISYYTFGPKCNLGAFYIHYLWKFSCDFTYIISADTLMLMILLRLMLVI